MCAQTEGEQRFFARCPHEPPRHLHDETRPWDLHTLLYTGLGVSEIEVFRAADWLLDAPLPGRPLQPFQRASRGIRRSYYRLPRWWVVSRFGEFVDALQIPELSLGDASTTYTVATGGTTGPGSGMVTRVHRLVDWAQHLTGDLNRLAGMVVMRPRGLITWSLPGRTIDEFQWGLLKTFNAGSVLIGRTLDGTLTAVEASGDRVINAGHRRPHRQTTVFLRLPRQVYRAHELWILEHRPQLVIGEAALFARATHAELAHHRRHPAVREWDPISRPGSGDGPVVIMMTTRVIARAPEPLRQYVVPAAWVLHPERPHQRMLTPH
ncbi:MAG: hypothetical protein HY599_04945 [Candidatus Omnitrophica bacterium]|nr:hypothetical protein [Candidatus Omnitrophota bacterium]